MNIYLLLLWLVPLVAFLSAGVIVATDKRVRHSQGRSISDRGLIAVIGEQTNPWTFAESNDEATPRIEPASMYSIRAPGGLSGGVMESKIKFVRHPLHPMLIVFPLGLLATAVAFDIVALASGNYEWFNISFLIMGVGILGGLLAALPGLADWVAIPKNTRAKAIGLWHGGGNVVVLILFAISWFIRRERAEVPNTGALVLSFFALALSLITAWLGGELVDRLGVGVDNGAHLNAPSSLSGRPATAEPVQPMRRAS
jgi:uncharacterized membrane protein